MLLSLETHHLRSLTGPSPLLVALVTSDRLLGCSCQVIWRALLADLLTAVAVTLGVTQRHWGHTDTSADTKALQQDGSYSSESQS